MTAARTLTLTTQQLRTLQDICDRGPYAWCDGVRSRAGGARARMCDRLVSAGLLKGPPYAVTAAGRLALKAAKGAA